MIAPATPPDRHAAIQVLESEARAHDSLLLDLCVSDPVAVDRLEERVRRGAEDFAPGTAAHDDVMAQLRVLDHARTRAAQGHVDLAAFMRRPRAGQAGAATPPEQL